MKRRNICLTGFGSAAGRAGAGTSWLVEFRSGQAAVFERDVDQVRWQNPHIEVMLRADAAKLPEGIRSTHLAGAAAVG